MAPHDLADINDNRNTFVITGPFQWYCSSDKMINGLTGPLPVDKIPLGNRGQIIGISEPENVHTYRVQTKHSNRSSHPLHQVRASVLPRRPPQNIHPLHGSTRLHLKHCVARQPINHQSIIQGVIGRQRRPPGASVTSRLTLYDNLWTRCSWEGPVTSRLTGPGLLVK